MDVITLSLAKKYANQVAAGYSSVRVDGMNLIFTLNDGSEVTMAIPAPADGKDGVSVQNLSIDNDGSLLCHMSDGTVIDAGKVPTIETEQIQADWNQNDETQPDYIKNRIGGYEAYQEIPMFENKTVTLTKAYPEIPDNYIYEYSLTDEEFNLYQQNFPYPEMTGKLVYEGKEYIQTGGFDVETFTCQIRFNTDTCEVCIPNLHYIWVEFYDAESVNTEFTFSLYKMESGIVTIPERYLPDTVATKEYVDNVVASAITSVLEGSY